MNIAITGEGIISAIGRDKAEVLDALRSGRSGIGTIKYLRSIHKELPVGEVDMSNTDMKGALGISADAAISRTALMGMLAITQAIDDAGLSRLKSGHKGLRILLVSGTTVGGMDMTEECFADSASQPSIGILRQHDCGNCTKTTAAHFGELFDDVVTISTACSSAANAIMFGARLIEQGFADIVVAGGSEALSRFHLNGFNSLMILDHERCRPFDETRRGLNLGEGAAYIVLQRAEAAVNPHAWLTGYGDACDAFHQTATSENGEGPFRAMAEALEEAGLQPSDIDYVNAHGTGTTNNDQSESTALKRVFGNRVPLVSSTKPFTGHATSAAGSIEAVICLLAMRHSFVPGNLGWEHQMTDGIAPTAGESNKLLNNVMCNSFGFGGNDTSLIFSSSPRGKVSHYNKAEVRVVSRVEITSVEELKELRKYIKPLEARRMGKLMKGAYLSSMKALEAAGITRPDAIITGTAYGCLENSEKLLLQMIEEGEASMKPSLFMQSTHNTIGSDIAIRTGCHGYNTTYTQCNRSLEWAVRDAEMLIRGGRYKNVLVGLHDESAPIFSRLMGEEFGIDFIHSVAMVLSCGD